MNSKEEGLEFYDLSHGIVGFQNVGGEIDEVTGKRVTLAAFPWRWVKGDESMRSWYVRGSLDPGGIFGKPLTSKPLESSSENNGHLRRQSMGARSVTHTSWFCHQTLAHGRVASHLQCSSA